MFSNYSSSQYRFDIEPVLRKYNLTVYDFVKRAMGPDDNPQSAMSQLYKLKNNKADRVRIDTLSEIVGALRDVTGEEIQIQDLLVYKQPTNTAIEQPHI